MREQPQQTSDQRNNPNTLSEKEYKECEILLSEIISFAANNRNGNTFEKEDIQKLQTEIYIKKEMIDKALKTINGFGVGIRILESIQRHVPDVFIETILYKLVKDNAGRIDREMFNAETLKTPGSQHAIYCCLLGGLANFKRKFGENDEATLQMLQRHAKYIREEAVQSPMKSKYISSLVELAESGEKEESAVLKEILDGMLVRGGNYPTSVEEAIKTIFSAPHTYTKQILLDSLQSQLGGKVSYERMLEAWKTAGPRFEYSIQKNLNMLLSLEREQPGVATVLYNNFRICNFGRYPEEMLLAQARDINDKNKPYGIIVYPLHDDNGAFFAHKEIFKKMFQQTQGVYNIRVTEAASKLDVARSLVRLDTLYGDTQKISFAILGGHGSRNSIQLGEKTHSGKLSVEDLKQSHIKTKRNEKSGIERTRKFFINQPPIVLVSCHTGEKEGPAEHLSRTHNTTITGPSDSTWLKAITVKKENDRPVVGIEYLKTESVTYTNGQKEEPAS